MKLKFWQGKTPQAPAIMGSRIRANRVEPQHASMMRTVNSQMLRMFEAAMTTNLNGDFPISITSANAENLVSITGTRSRSRALERDNPYGRSILSTFQNNVVGSDPFRLEMNDGTWSADGLKFVKNVKLNRQIEAAWAEAGLPENCTVMRNMSRLEMDLQTLTAVIRDGGIIHRHYRNFPNNDFRYAIKPIEIDQLDHYYNRPAKGTDNEIQFSVEMDEYSGPLAYHILMRHPGDVYFNSNQPKYRERVPAEDIIALFDLRTRAGQIVGMPNRMASVIRRLQQLDQWQLAHVTAAIWASCKPFFITQDFPTAMDYVPDYIKTMMQGAENTGQQEGERTNTVEPGTGEVLAYGQKPVLMDPKFPTEAGPAFVKEQLRGASSGAGVPYHIVGGDLESINFSAGRIGLQEFRDGCKILQRHFILSHRRPHFNAWLKYAILSGKIDAPIERLPELQLAAKFFGRRWPYIQPLQDAQADQVNLQNRTTTRDWIVADNERGGTYLEIAQQTEEDNETDESHGLSSFDPWGAQAPAEDQNSDETEITETPAEKTNGKSRFPGFKRNGNGHKELSRI